MIAEFGPVLIRIIKKSDAAQWGEMRESLWPSAADIHAREINDFYSYGLGPTAVLVASEEEQILGFLELSLRSYAEGSAQTEVPFVEGWYVREEHRGRGIGRKLMAAAQRWSRDLGYKELGSDTDLDNELSIAAHQALGFREVGRQVSFLMDL